MLYDDSVRVPPEAVPGKATLRVTLISETGKIAGPTELSVMLK